MAAGQFSVAVDMVMGVVPLHTILAVSDTVMADVDEDEEGQPEASTSRPSGAVLPFMHKSCQVVI